MAIYTNVYGDGRTPDYEGCVLDWYEHNGYDDSDWYAICWNKEKQTIDKVLFNTTRCACGGRAEIDATPEVLRKVYRYWKNIGRAMFDNRTNPEQAKKPHVGDTVRIVGGRKFKKGTECKVFWAGSCHNPYSGCTEDRLGVEADGNRQFIKEEQAELVDWQARLMTGKERKRRIQNFAANSMPAHYRPCFSKSEWEWERNVEKELSWKWLVG